jgi:transcriptional activator SPT7
MRRKTERLMSRVPNISIKERIETEIEEEGDDMSEEEENEPERVSRKSSGKHMVSIERKTTPIIPNDRQQSRERSVTRGSSAAPLSAVDALFGSDIENALTPDMVGTPQHMQYGGKNVKKSGDEDDENIDLEQEEKKLGAEIDADMGELQDQVWRDKTKKTRAKLTVSKCNFV